jgi:chorismate synthase
MIRFLTSGESHGKGLTVTIEGLPAGIPLSMDYIQNEMLKRKKGVGSGGRQLIENDEIEIYTGVRFGKTLGSPLTMIIPNKDFQNWGEKMSSEDKPQELKDKICITEPRPGHADLVGTLKYGYDDVRNVLERASARETTARVAAGAIFKQFLQACGIDIASHTIQIGEVKLEQEDYTFEDIKNVYTNEPETRCIDPEKAHKMKEAVHTARTNRNTLGGVVETWAVNLPPGLGSHVHFDRKIDGQIAQALMSIQSVKAVEIGHGVEAAGLHGADVHDEVFYSEEKGYYRETNRAGGIEGGMTNGEPIVVRVYHKPISTLYKPLKTVDIQTKEPVEATVERSDICIVPRGGVVSEAMLAYVLANSMVEKFGGDRLDEIQSSLERYRKEIKP